LPLPFAASRSSPALVKTWGANQSSSDCLPATFEKYCFIWAVMAGTLPFMRALSTICGS
jgi:hypothetical protein